MTPYHPRYQKLLVSAAASAAFCAATGATSPALGQEMTAQSGEFSVQRFEPVAGPRNYLTVAGGRTDGEMTWSAGLMFDYQREPFVLQSCMSADNCDEPGDSNPQNVAVVSDMLTWNLLTSLTPHPIVQIGLRVPVAFSTGEGLDTTTGTSAAQGLSGVGMGDINLEGKVRFLGEPDDIIVLAGAADLSAPVGHATSEGNYIGNDTPIGVGGRAIVDFNIEDFSAAANLRGIWREDSRLGDTNIGPEFRWGVGAGYQFHHMFRAILEGFGGTRFSDKNGTNSMEVDGGVQILPLDSRLVITAAAGTGVVKGVGVPIARAIVGVSFNYDDVVTDDDGDGVDNAVDECPSEPEDRDNIGDEDGCPEVDYDGDKLPDDIDSCPEEPETENMFEDDDGCPDTALDKDGDGILDEKDKCPDAAGDMKRPDLLGCPDSDKDGVPDHADKCKDEVEDTDGFEDTDGCPDPDNDGDGVPDVADECSDEKEIMNGVKDGDGCPDFGPDGDGDGVLDDKDACLQLPENYNGNQDDDGCPDAGITLVNATKSSIETVAPVRFIDDDVKDPVSLRILAAVAGALKNFTGILKLEVKVTTNQARAAAAKPRAEAVIAKLVAAGIDRKRLVLATATGNDEGVSFTVKKNLP